MARGVESRGKYVVKLMWKARCGLLSKTVERLHPVGFELYS